MFGTRSLQPRIKKAVITRHLHPYSPWHTIFLSKYITASLKTSTNGVKGGTTTSAYRNGSTSKESSNEEQFASLEPEAVGEVSDGVQEMIQELARTANRMEEDDNGDY